MITYPIGLINPKVGGNIPVDGLIAYYPFNGNANDESGNGNDGITNNVTLDVGRNGDDNTAYRFTKGIDSYVDVSSIGHLPEFSISIWYNADSGTALGMFNKGSFINNHGDYSLVFPSVLSSGLRFRINDGSIILDSYHEENYLNWKNVVFGIYNNVMEIYINGIFENSIAAATISNLYDIIRIGQSYSSAYSFNGKLTDIRVYNRALTQEEITQLYNE